MKKRFDVAIVGGGPIGCLLGADLASSGFDVCIFEEHEAIGKPLHCAGIVGEELLRKLGIPEDLILFEHKAAKFSLLEGAEVRIEASKPKAFTLDRAEFDLYLSELARSKGAFILTGKKVRKVEKERHLKVKLWGGEEFSATFCVVASGSFSSLPKDLGFGGFPSYAFAYQAIVESGIEETEIYLSPSLLPGGFGWLSPRGSGEASAGVIVRGRGGEALRYLLKELSERGKIGGVKGRPRGGIIPVAPRRSSAKEGIFLVGGAAGQNKPTTGGGILWGVLCAERLAEILKEALSGNLPPEEACRAYERGWRGTLGEEMRRGIRLRLLFERLREGEVERLLFLLPEIAKRILESPDFSFDRHGCLLFKALRILLHPSSIPLILRKGSLLLSLLLKFQNLGLREAARGIAKMASAPAAMKGRA